MHAGSGEVLWKTQLSGPISMSNITYSVEGRQYVAVIASGSAFGGPLPRGPDGRPLNNESLIAFALPE